MGISLEAVCLQKASPVTTLHLALDPATPQSYRGAVKLNFSHLRAHISPVLGKCADPKCSCRLHGQHSEGHLTDILAMFFVWAIILVTFYCCDKNNAQNKLGEERVYFLS